MKKILSLLLSIIFAFSISTTTHAKEESLQLYAQSAVLMDGESGRILYAKNGEDTKANASTTKILTCILALEYGDLQEVLTASQTAAIQPKVHLGVSPGEEYYLKDLLYALMLESYNDCAVMIAEHISGSVEGFASLMNEKAREIGCVDTYFITPNGLDAQEGYESHHTTASDLALLMKYCIKDSPKVEEFLEITQTPSYTINQVNGGKSKTLTNRNSLLTMMTGAISGKTGFTNDAGYCYVGALESEGRTFIIALLACGWPNNRNYKWSDSKTLLQYGMDNYQYEVIGEETQQKELKAEVYQGKTLEEEYYIDLKEGITPQIKLLKREDEEVEIVYEYPKIIYAPIEKNTVVGTVRYLVEGEVWKLNSLGTTQGIEEEDFPWKMYKKVKNIF